MKVAYVGGPYRADTVHEIAANIRAAESYAVELWKEGWAVICPYATGASQNSAFLDGAVPDETFLAGDLELLARCDVLVLIDGWRDSKGALSERDHAYKLGIPVYDWRLHRELLSRGARTIP